jgi:tRNA-Thr(GGU) m(6)t(6)A37 methyltransferase TsaA
MDKITIRPMGVAHTPFLSKEDMPIQPAGAAGIEGTIEVFPEFRDGLKDLDGFSHIIVVFNFHRAEYSKLVTVPFRDDTPRGVFATRSPHRPSGIGISVVRLLEVAGGTLRVQNVDMLDGTPVLDIKPYIPRSDSVVVDSMGWLEGISHEFVTARAGDPPPDRDEDGIAVRRFTMDDYDAVISFWDGEDSEHKPLGRDRRESIERELALPTSVFLVAETDGRIVGTVFGTHDGRKGWINRLVVASDLRRQGLAGRLVTGVERRLSEMGIDIVGVLVWDSNAPSIAAIESYGYERHDDCLYFSKRKGPDV